MDLSFAMREYLAEIYRLQADEPEVGPDDELSVSTTSLAERLDVSAPAVPRMLKRLRNAGLVTHTPYKGFSLTELGKREALKELRRHRILEVFLVEIMGFTWDEAHDHSDDLGQGLNDAITARMAEMTGHPTRCPHGEPIPALDGSLPLIDDICLMNLGVGQKGVVSRVRTHDPERLRYFRELNLVPGTPIEIVGRAPFNGPMRLTVNRDEVVLGVELTKSLWISTETDGGS